MTEGGNDLPAKPASYAKTGGAHAEGAGEEEKERANFER